KNIVPKRVQFVSARWSTELYIIPAVIAVRVGAADTSCSVQRLMYVAHEVLQPHEIVGFLLIRISRGQHRTKYGDLRASIWSGYRGQRCTVSRKRRVHKMPVFVMQMICVADILYRCRPVRPIPALGSIIGVSLLTLNLIWPSRRDHERHHLLVCR